MPLASLVHYLSAASATQGLYTALWCGLGIALVGAVRAWSKGYVCVEERQLAGRTFILTGAFSGTGLAVFQSLASRGAQVIALHPGAPTPSIVQLVVLLREATRNERLYADECDLASVDSIRAFVLRWRKDAKAGMVGDVDVRVDGVLFLDSDDDEALAFGAAQKWAPQRAAPDERVSRHRMRRLTGRHALVQLLLPVLLDSARTSTSPLRVISAVSPFYAVAAAQPGRLFRPEDLDYLAEGNEFPTTAPWEAEGQTALAAVLLWRELQSRLSSLAASGASASAGKTATPDAAAPAAAPILALSVCPGLTRSSILSLLAPSLRRAPLRLLLALLGAPLVWLLAKSADEAAQGVLGTLMARVEGESEAQRAAREEVHEGEEGRGAGKKVGRREEREEEDGKRRMRVRGGALYREGREVRIPALDALPPTAGAALWDSESKLVERLLLAAVEAQKQEDKDKDKEQVQADRAPTEPKKDV